MPLLLSIEKTDGEEALSPLEEPYVVAADVYSVSPHAGRGGWTWYTGAASWMYRLIVEFLLGLRREADRFYCILWCYGIFDGLLILVLPGHYHKMQQNQKYDSDHDTLSILCSRFAKHK
jgi:hypothetical protein